MRLSGDHFRPKGTQCEFGRKLSERKKPDESWRSQVLPASCLFYLRNLGKVQRIVWISSKKATAKMLLKSGIAK